VSSDASAEQWPEGRPDRRSIRADRLTNRGDIERRERSSSRVRDSYNREWGGDRINASAYINSRVGMSASSSKRAAKEAFAAQVSTK
jgi:hypothetical protein